MHLAVPVRREALTLGFTQRGEVTAIDVPNPLTLHNRCQPVFIGVINPKGQLPLFARRD